MPNQSSNAKPLRRKPDEQPVRCILTVTGGSSSIKFALYRADSPITRLLSGNTERISLPGPTLTIREGLQKSAPLVIAVPITVPTFITFSETDPTTFDHAGSLP